MFLLRLQEQQRVKAMHLQKNNGRTFSRPAIVILIFYELLPDNLKKLLDDVKNLLSESVVWINLLKLLEEWLSSSVVALDLEVVDAEVLASL